MWSIVIRGVRRGGGVQGVQVNPPFFKLNIHSMALACIKIPTKFTETEINIDTVCKLYLQKYPRT